MTRGRAIVERASAGSRMVEAELALERERAKKKGGDVPGARKVYLAALDAYAGAREAERRAESGPEEDVPERIVAYLRARAAGLSSLVLESPDMTRTCAIKADALLSAATQIEAGLRRGDNQGGRS